MSIEAQLTERLKAAMRAKDARTADCIRMIKTKHMERRTAAGFKGPLDAKAASDDEVRATVRETLVRLGVSDAKQAGRVVGDIMKANKGKLEASVVKRIVDEELAPKS